jgi:hypothetical protein
LCSRNWRRKRRRKTTRTKEAAGKEKCYPRVQRSGEKGFFGTNATGGLECEDRHQNGFAKGGIRELVFLREGSFSETAS